MYNINDRGKGFLKMKSSLPEVLRAMEEAATPDSALHQQIFSVTSGSEVNSEDLSAFFRNLLKGAMYVYEKFGTTFDSFKVFTGTLTVGKQQIEKPTIGMIENREDGNTKYELAIPLHEIINLISLEKRRPPVKLSSDKTGPHGVSPAQMVALFGVEEAYHQHQYRTNAEKYRHESHITENTGERYSNKLVEREAAVIVSEAMKHFGFYAAGAESSG